MRERIATEHDEPEYKDDEGYVQRCQRAYKKDDGGYESHCQRAGKRDGEGYKQHYQQGDVVVKPVANTELTRGNDEFAARWHLEPDTVMMLLIMSEVSKRKEEGTR